MHLVYDEAGHLLLNEWDRDDDGTVDVRRTYTYDEHGWRATQDVDDDSDGTVDRHCVYEPCPPEWECDPECANVP